MNQESQSVTLAQLLRMPDDDCMLPEAWRQIVKGHQLFDALHGAVTSNGLGNAVQLIDEWRQNLPMDQAKTEWEIAAALVWCAENASKAPDSIRSPKSPEELMAYQSGIELTRCCFAIRSTDYKSQSLIDWAWGCIRTFLNAPKRARILHVPVAAWKPAENKGLLSTLQMDLRDPGTGDIFHHPMDGFATMVDAEFNDSMRDAWTAAKELAKAEGHSRSCDARWRLLEGWSWDRAKRDALSPTDLANERSASGAAARGWWYALTNKVPDEEVVVVAQIDAAGNLSSVNGVGAKARAIADAGGFDTIAVVKDNEKEAEQALKKIGKLGMVSVEDIATYEVRAKARRARQEASAAK